MLIYLACPYSSPHADIRELRFQKISKLAGELITKGNAVFCPIAQSHPMHLYGNMSSTEWEHWWYNDITNLINCNELWIADFPGWDRSVGVRGEIIAALELCMPIKIIDPASHLRTFVDYPGAIIGELTKKDREDIQNLKDMILTKKVHRENFKKT